MAIAVRLLMGGGGTFTAHAPFALTTAPAGGWTQANDPHAIYDATAGRTFFGYIDGTSGNAEIRSYDHTTKTTSAATVLHAALDIDTHAAPSLLVLPNGHLLAAYSPHDGATLYVRISTNAHDATAWGAEQNLDATLGGLDYTYPHLHLVGSTVYLFYRDWQGGDTGVLCYSTSADNGATWTAQTELYKNAGKSSYWSIDSDGSRIDIAATNGRNPPDAGNTPFGHFYISGGSRYKSDGTLISSALPLAYSDLTEVYSGSDGVGWTFDIVAGSTPVLTYAVLDSGSTNSWRYARWNGSAWVLTTIASSAGVIDSGFAASVVLDHSNISVTYAAVKVGSHWETQRFTSADSGATWTMATMTVGSSVDNILQTTVRDHAPDLVVLWLYGTYTTYLNTSLGIMGGV